MVSKLTETGQPILVLHAVRTGVSAEAGRGRATVPPPKPHPQCTRRERRTRTKGSGDLAPYGCIIIVQAAYSHQFPVAIRVHNNCAGCIISSVSGSHTGA